MNLSIDLENLAGNEELYEQLRGLRNLELTSLRNLELKTGLSRIIASVSHLRFGLYDMRHGDLQGFEKLLLNGTKSINELRSISVGKVDDLIRDSRSEGGRLKSTLEGRGIQIETFGDCKSISSWLKKVEQDEKK